MGNQLYQRKVISKSMRWAITVPTTRTHARRRNRSGGRRGASRYWCALGWRKRYFRCLNEWWRSPHGWWGRANYSVLAASNTRFQQQTFPINFKEIKSILRLVLYVDGNQSNKFVIPKSAIAHQQLGLFIKLCAEFPSWDSFVVKANRDRILKNYRGYNLDGFSI